MDLEYLIDRQFRLDGRLVTIAEYGRDRDEVYVGVDFSNSRDRHVAYIVSRDEHLVGLIIGAKSTAIPYREGKIARIKPEKRTSPTDWVEERRV